MLLTTAFAQGGTTKRNYREKENLIGVMIGKSNRSDLLPYGPNETNYEGRTNVRWGWVEGKPSDKSVQTYCHKKNLSLHADAESQLYRLWVTGGGTGRPGALSAGGAFKPNAGTLCCPYIKVPETKKTDAVGPVTSGNQQNLTGLLARSSPPKGVGRRGRGDRCRKNWARKLGGIRPDGGQSPKDGMPNRGSRSDTDREEPPGRLPPSNRTGKEQGHGTGCNKENRKTTNQRRI